MIVFYIFYHCRSTGFSTNKFFFYTQATFVTLKPLKLVTRANSPVKWLIYKIKAQACSNSVVRLGIVRGVSRTFLPPPQINNQTLFISLYEYLFISKEKSCIFYSIIKYHSHKKHLWVYYFSTGFDNKYFKNHNSNFKILEVLTKNSGNQFQTIKIDL